MFNSLLAIDTTTIMYIVIGVVLVLMVVLTIIPQKKRQKKQQEMMNSLSVGTKVMTIGRMVGKIVQVNDDSTLIVNVGTEDSPTLIVIDKNAVGLVLENVAAAPVAPVETATESTEVFEESKADEVVVEEAEVVETEASDKTE